jgi:hypothetical protein
MVVVVDPTIALCHVKMPVFLQTGTGPLLGVAVEARSGRDIALDCQVCDVARQTSAFCRTRARLLSLPDPHLSAHSGLAEKKPEVLIAPVWVQPCNATDPACLALPASMRSQ